MAHAELQQYLAVLILLVLAVATTGGMIGLSALLGKRGARSRARDTAYECGMVPVGQSPPRLSVKFYLVAMLFILFDIVVVFLYPWAVVYRDFLAEPAMRHVILVAALSFLGILSVGYLYAVKKRAFDWKS